MSIEYFRSLLYNSSRIQQEIEKEHQRPWPDWTRLRKLKKLRLSIKDRMEWLFNGNRMGKLKPVRVKTQ